MSLANRSLTLATLVALAVVTGRSASADFLTVDVTGVGAALPTALLPGQSVNVAIDYHDTTSGAKTVASFDSRFLFDATQFTISNVGLGTLDPAGNGFSGVFNTAIPGSVSAAISAADGTNVDTGTVGSLETFTLTVNPGATAGVTNLNSQVFVVAGTTSGTNQTAVFFLDGTRVLSQPSGRFTTVFSPAITNNFDPGVDAAITIVSASVPEPSSFALAGLGVVGLAIGRKFRRRNVA